MTLAAEPAKYTGPCPGRITFTGSITTDGPAKVPYQFHSWLKFQDGKYKSWPGGVLTFAEAGTQSISKTIIFVGDGTKFSSQMDVGTAIPNPMHSKLVPFSVECSGAAESNVATRGGEVAQQNPATGPFASQAKVEVKWKGTVIPLKREEQIAFLFVVAIHDQTALRKLKFDPNATDPNYSYKVDGGEVWASPRRPGLGGFYQPPVGMPTYNPAGPATENDKEIDHYSIEGEEDLFEQRQVTPRGSEMAQQNRAAGPFATQANVEVKSHGTVIPLKREEQIAFIFVQAIRKLEDDCRWHAAEPCTLDALVRGPKSKDETPLGKLKFDPNATDPNYSYKVVPEVDNWRVWANPRRPGLGGFYVRIFSTYYNPAGPATENDKEINEAGIGGDDFLER
jgi:hypothetical protein